MHIALGRGTQNYSCPLTINSSTVPTSTGAVATLYNTTSLRLYANTGRDPLLAVLGDGSTLTSYALSLPDPNAYVVSPNSNSTDHNITTESNYNGNGKHWSTLGLEISGHHYFAPSKTHNSSAAPIPHFDLSAIGLGSANAAKNATSAAPVLSALSITPSSFSNANANATHPDATSPSLIANMVMPATDVPWLYLRALDVAPSSSSDNGHWKEVYRVNTRGGVAPSTCAGLEGKGFVVEYAAEYWFFG